MQNAKCKMLNAKVKNAERKTHKSDYFKSSAQSCASKASCFLVCS